ncbi:DNA-binding MarR family transcriptional regulator [Kribbella voronezhensis]|uniref:DNA-binding MarR family transcriptional regulator n=1 Tax=Kribbella voronezhensis TaxID=2512212 RepID=A0A4R7TAY0_9ACTN|nr:MarR family winged helix-turn-helix transcriptional regulator [Kribbella voronezhensis]TDU89115.1 DNA-binding MarR family transcriptional regulator [Kribbella voronezhensis]
METLLGMTTFVLHKVGVAGRRAIAERLAVKPGITLWQLAALAELGDQGPAAQNELAAGLGVDPSDMVRLMDGLLADGLVSRDRDPADRRRYRISLTPQGKKALSTARTVVRDVEKTTLHPLTATERATLHRLVTKIHQRP